MKAEARERLGDEGPGAKTQQTSGRGHGLLCWHMLYGESVRVVGPAQNVCGVRCGL